MNTETKIKNFTDLNAWKEGHKLVLLVYKTTKKFPKEEVFGIVSQMRRAVVSVTSNVAEGFSRKTSKEKYRFYTISIGSITELQNQLIISRDLNYINESEFNILYNQSVEVKKVVSGLKKIYGIRYTVTDTRSFTLVELLIAVGIIGVLATVGIINIASYKNKHSFDLDAESITEALRNAQDRSITQESGQGWSIRFTNSTTTDDYFEIFPGTTYSVSSVVARGNLSYASEMTNPAAGFSKTVSFSAISGKPVSVQVIAVKQKAGPTVASIFAGSGGQIGNFQESGLVGYWPMDEGSGNYAYDASGSSNTGTVTIGATGSQTTVAQAWSNGASGKVGGSLNFDGTDDYTNANPNSSLDITSAFTFIAWIYPTSYPTEGIIFNKESTYEWATMPSGDIKWAINNTTPSWTWIDTGLTVPLNQWTHFVITYNGSSVVTYKNGGSQIYTYSPAVGNLIPNGNALKIAARAGPTSFFAGKLDDVRIYNRALSATEVKSLYESY